MAQPELIILGSSAGVPTGRRFPTALLFKIDGALYLVDCGAPVVNRLKALGESPLALRAVFLTHWHPDHATSLPMLLQDLQLTGRKEPLTVYGPPGTSAKLDSLLRIFLIPREVLPYSLAGADVADGCAFEDGWVRIDYFPTNHLNTPGWRELDAAHDGHLWPFACGVAIEIGPIRVVISGDIQGSDDLVPYIGGASLVSHEYGHMSLESIRDFAVDHSIKRLLVTHIHHEWDTRPDELRRILSDGFQGELFLGSDGLRIPLEP
jgi:ribonuclease BN (tRNA processing enzyme)